MKQKTKRGIILVAGMIAEIAQLVDPDLGKVGVASSTLVFRSKRLAVLRGVYVCGPGLKIFGRLGTKALVCA